MTVPSVGRAGLTLIEVIISLTLLSFAGMIIFTALNTSMTAWGAGLLSGRRDQVARIALARMSQQLKSALPVTVEEDGRAVTAFEGGNDRLRFVTTLSAGGDRPAVQVSYSIEEGGGERSLVYREYPWPDKEFFDSPDPVKEERLPEVSNMEIELTSRTGKGEGDDEGESEREEWKGGREEGLPAEAEVTLTVAGGEGVTYTTVIPLLAAEAP